VVSPPGPTTEAGATCGTQIRFLAASAATECELELCGMVSIRVPNELTTPSTAQTFCIGGWAMKGAQTGVAVYDLLAPR